MLAVHSQKNANYLHILGVLRYLRDEKDALKLVNTLI